MGDRSWCFGFGFGTILAGLCYLNGWVWLPDTLGLDGYALVGLGVTVSIFNYLNEYLLFFPLKYSKFAPDGGVPARLGWFIMYFAPMVVYLISWKYIGAPSSSYDILVMSLYCCHFSKRCLEVIFLHKYSKDCLLESVIQVGSFYSLGAVVTAYSSHVLPDRTARSAFLDDSFRIKFGLGVYSFGQLCNLYHHYLLATLRTPGSFKYVIPKGGLFSLVICPQYLGELLSWLGFSIVGYNFGLYLCYIPMVAYLCARAHHTYRWYQSKFDDYPYSYTLKLWPFVY